MVIKITGEREGRYSSRAPSLRTNGGALAQSGEITNTEKAPGAEILNQITLHFVDGPRGGQTHQFSLPSVPITLGRAEKNSIAFPGTSLSRVQCQIDYLDGKWIIRDGNGEKRSTNGTWIYAEDEQRIESGMVVKAGQSLFRLQFLERAK